MKKQVILLLYPYDGMRAMLEQDLDGLSGDMARICLAAESMFRELPDRLAFLSDYDAVLAQGALYQSLLPTSPCPCFEISLSHMDILTASKLCASQQEKAILLSSGSVTEKAASLFRMLGMPIDVLSNHSLPPEAALRRCIDAQYRLFIADSDYAPVCRSAGVQPVMLTCGYESIIAGVRTVLHYLGQIRREALALNVLERYYADTDSAVLMFDSCHRLLRSLREDAPDKLLKAVLQYIPVLEQEQEIQRISVIHSQPCLIKGRRVRIGAQTFFLFEIKKSFSNSKTTIPGITIKNIGSISTDFYSAFYDDLQNPEFRSKTLAYSRSASPVVIIGESGTGKSRLADYIYHNCEFRDNPFYLVDCKQLDKRGLYYMFSSINSPLYENNITLYFKEINLMNQKYFYELIEFLGQSVFMKNNKLIFSVTCSINESYNNRLCELLTSKLGSFPLFLVPLRDRKKAIPGLAILYVNRLNESSSRQIAGIEPEAMDYLCSFGWNDNIKQFKRVLNELCTVAAENHITKQDVISLLKEESMRDPGNTPSASSSTTGLSLDEIIGQAVKDALIANQMNQTKTAAQLGIGRTTLWRILNK